VIFELIGKNADGIPYSSLPNDSSPPELQISKNTQWYHCLTP
jgi:hypothetical protein